MERDADRGGQGPNAELIERAMEASGTALAIAGPTLALTYVNRAFLRLWGFAEPEQVLGRIATGFWSDPAAAETVAREVAWSGSWSGEMQARRSDGSEFTARAVVNLFRDPPEAPPRLVATFTDVTERVKLEQQLRHAQKLEAIGLLAGGVAHDFNNLLTVILSGAEFLEETLGPGDPRRADAAQILGAARRAEGLTRQLLAFGRRQVLHPRRLDLNEALGGVGMMVRRIIGEDVKVTFALAARPPIVEADPALLEQALMNLVVNARDAMPGGGELRISTELREVRGADATRLDVPAGRYAVLTVADTGSGMDEATLSRIFEPFFTTKAPGSGSGLGLPTVYGIARQAGGTVEVRSSPGAGAAFGLLFPAREEGSEAPTRSPPPRPPPPGARSPVVLIAEDEGAVRSVAERCLVQRGYRVRSAPDGESALRAAEEMEELDLLLTDVVMPGMNGRQLAEALAKVRPGTPVLFMTGYTDDTALRLGIEAHRVRILAKPFTPDGLAAAVAAAMARAPPA